jgi:integrase
MARNRGKLPTGIVKDPTNAGSYMARVMVGGRLIRRRIGTNIRAGVAWIAHVREEARKGRLLPGAGGDVQVGVLVEEFNRRNKDRWRSAKDQARYAAFWKDKLGNRRLASLTASDIEDAISPIASKRAASTTNSYLTFLRAALNAARRDGRIHRNPMDGVKLHPEPAGRVRFLSDEEEKRLRAAMRPEAWRVVAFALGTGARQASQFGLRWSDVSWESGKIYFSVAKGGRPYHVPMTATVRAILADMPGPDVSEWVFSSAPDGSFAKQKAHNFVNRVFVPALERAGIGGFRWHDLRHTFASRLVVRGVPLKTVATYMGHTSTQMVDRRYAHLAPAHFDAAILVLDEPRTSADSGARVVSKVVSASREGSTSRDGQSAKRPSNRPISEPRQEGFEPPTHGLEGRCSIP